MANPGLRNVRNSDPRLSALDVHLVPRKPPSGLYDKSPTGARSSPSSAPRLGQPMHRKKSTKELVAQFEAREAAAVSISPQHQHLAQRLPQTTPRRRATLSKRHPGHDIGVPYSSMPRVSSNLIPPQRPHSTGLTPPKPPEEYSPPKKDRSPLRESLRNIFAIFKKGKSPKGKENREEDAYQYQREKEIFRDTWHGDTNETAARRMTGRIGESKATPEKALPPVTPEQRQSGSAPLRSGHLYYLTAERQWTKRHVSLEPPFLYMTDPVLATPSLAMRLESLSSVHSLPRSSALTLPPIRQKDFPEEPYVFELEFEGGKRVELFALESASVRSSWVSVFWDAVLSMQPGPSLPPPSQQEDDPFLSPSLTDLMAPRRPLRVMNGPVPVSPSSRSLPSPMVRGDSGDNIPPVSGSGGQESGGKSKLRQSSVVDDIAAPSDNVIGILPVGPQPAALQSRPMSRPLPIVPHGSSPPIKAEPPSTSTMAVAEEEGADVIRFPSAFSRRSRTTPGTELSAALFSPETEDTITSPTSPASIHSADTLRSPAVAVEPKEMDDTIRLSSIRSPSPPLSRQSSYATTTNSPRSPSMQTLSQMSVVRLRLAKLEAGEARVVPTSPKHIQNAQAEGDTPNRRSGSKVSSIRTPPLTIRKRGTTLLSRFPAPPTIGEVSTAGEESSTESNLGRTLSGATMHANVMSQAETEESHRVSHTSGQTHFTSARTSPHRSGYPIEWPDSNTDQASGSGGMADNESGSSSATTRSSFVVTPSNDPAQLDLEPVIAMLEPLPGQYSDLSIKMDDVKAGLGNVAGDVHKALQTIAELRTDIAATAAPDRAMSGLDEEAWQHVRRQLSELIMLVSDSVGTKVDAPSRNENGEADDPMQVMRNIGKANRGTTRPTEMAAAEDGTLKNESGSDERVPAPSPEELAHLFEPLLEQQKHLHLQQTDTIRYLNELNPWLQKLALATEKADEIPTDVRRIAKALGIHTPNNGEEDAGSEGAPTFVAQLMHKLDGIRGIVEANQQSREAMDAVMKTLVDQRQEQEKLLRTVAADLSNDIRGERLRFVDAMKEATTLNVQVHLEEFKKQLNQEVLRMTQDVGHLRDEKMKLEQAIAELFAIKAKHGEHLHQLQQATQQVQHPNHQPQARQSQQKAVPPQPVQQYIHPQPMPGMLYNFPGSYQQQQQHHQLPQAQQMRYPAPLGGGRLQVPAPLASQQPARQGTQASRPLPTAGPRSAASGPRSARQ